MMPDEKQLAWGEVEINRIGELHPCGMLFDGEVQLWVVSADAGGFDPKGRCRVSLKSNKGEMSHGLINNWEVFNGADAAKEAAQQYVNDNWDDVLALKES